MPSALAGEPVLEHVLSFKFQVSRDPLKSISLAQDFANQMVHDH